MADLLDIAFPPPAAVLVSDAKAAGARTVGLYCINWSVPRAEQSPAYVRDVRQRGMPILPIVVPGDHPGPVSAVISALTAWGVGPSDRVAVDLERYSLPPESWVIEFHRLWAAAGIYCQAGYRASYESAQPSWWWLAAWDGKANVSPGWNAHQFGPYRGPSGTLYDASAVLLTLRFWGEPSLPPTQSGKEDHDMDFILETGGRRWVPADQTTEWNVTVQGEGQATVVVTASGPDRKPLGPALGTALPRVLQGNAPPGSAEQLAPETIAGHGAQGGALLYFGNDGPAPVQVLVRYA